MLGLIVFLILFPCAMTILGWIGAEWEAFVHRHESSYVPEEEYDEAEALLMAERYHREDK